MSYTTNNDDEQRAVVCDNGSGMVKAGFSGEDAPRVVDAVLSPEFPEGSCVLGVDYDIPRCFDLDDATKVRVDNQRIVEIARALIGDFCEIGGRKHIAFLGNH